MEDKEFKAMVSLLDDKDAIVFQIVEKKLLEMGISVIPELEKAWENTMNANLHSRIENVIQKIQYHNTETNLTNWINDSKNDILEGAFWITKYQYPDLKLEDLTRQINRIVEDIDEEMPEHITPLEKIRTINHVFYDIFLFAGNNANFYAPQNSYINHVLETKKGNPITLAICYIYIARKLNLPIYGVNLPKNLILAYLNEKNNPKDISKIEQDDILFYINPYNKGAVLGKREIEHFLTQQKIPSHQSFYLPCYNTVIIQRLILNLIYSYEKLGYPNKIEDFKKLDSLFRNPLSDDIPY